MNKNLIINEIAAKVGEEFRPVISVIIDEAAIMMASSAEHLKLKSGDTFWLRGIKYNVFGTDTNSCVGCDFRELSCASTPECEKLIFKRVKSK